MKTKLNNYDNTKDYTFLIPFPLFKRNKKGAKVDSLYITLVYDTERKEEKRKIVHFVIDEYSVE